MAKNISRGEGEDSSSNLFVSSSACCSSSSSPVTVSDQLALGFLGSASNSLQNDSGYLYEFPPGASSSTGNIDAEFGFSRADFRKEHLCGTVPFYQRHVFLCYKNPAVWPPRVEAAEFDRLPRILHAAFSARKSDMVKEVRLTICEGYDGTKTSNGDVLIFPDMVTYRRLTHFDVENFVDEVLVKDGEWLPGSPAILEGSYVFVCCHGSRDRFCGVCGPPLISRFKSEIEARRMQGVISVSPCSHVGGHRFAGNVLIFGPDSDGNIAGHWYGYVSPDDVPFLLDQHILKREIVEFLWRGQMGLTEEEQINCQLRRRAKREYQTSSIQKGVNGLSTSAVRENKFQAETASVRECQNEQETDISSSNESKRSESFALFETWEWEDTYAAFAALFAVVSVFVAYKCFRNMRQF